MAEGWIEAESAGDALVLRAGGEWCLAGAAALDRKFGALRLPPAREVRIDLGAIEALDTAGAWLLLKLERGLAQKGAAVTLENLARELEPLLHQVEKGEVPAPPPRRRRGHGLADGLG